MRFCSRLRRGPPVFLVIILVSLSLSPAVFAQDFSGDHTVSDPSFSGAGGTPQQAQLEKDFKYDNLRAQIIRSNDQNKANIDSQIAAQQQALTQCNLDRSNASLQAESDNSQAHQQATQQLVQQGAQGLTPLLSNGLGTSQGGKQQAESDITGAINDQKTAATLLNRDCEIAFTTYLNREGTNSAASRSAVNNLLLQIDDNTKKEHPNCEKAINRLQIATTSGAEAIREANLQKSKSGEFNTSLLAAAAQVGIAAWGSSNANKAADQSLASAKTSIDQQYQACTAGVVSQVNQLYASKAALDKALADDLAMLQRQYNLEGIPNVQTTLDLASSAPTGLGQVANSPVPESNFKSQNLNNALADKGNANAPAGGAAAQGPGSGGEGNAKYSFGDPNRADETPYLSGLAAQPNGANYVEGVGGSGSGAPGGSGDGLLGGFQDPFANVAERGLASTSSGNGMWELALKSRRRVYAHLSELLGKNKVTAPKIAKDQEKTPERKLSSVRN